MSEKKIVVPKGMLLAALAQCEKEVGGHQASLARPSIERLLESSLRWLDGELDNRVRTMDYGDLCRSPEFSESDRGWNLAILVIRRMFLAPEPELPEAVRDLLLVDAVTFELPDGKKFPGSAADRNAAVIEAYHRGQKAGQ